MNSNATQCHRVLFWASVLHRRNPHTSISVYKWEAWARAYCFLQSDSAATIFSLLAFVWLLFECSFHFFGNPADISDGWIRYVWVRWWRLLDAVSSTRSFSVLLSAVESTHTTWIALTLAWWPLSEIICACVHMPCIVATATIRGQRLFVQSFRFCGYCLRETTIWQRHLFEEIWYVPVWLPSHNRVCTLELPVAQTHSMSSITAGYPYLFDGIRILHDSGMFPIPSSDCGKHFSLVPL